MTSSENTAISIYAVMARDVCDAIELIQECGDREALAMLLQMLELEREAADTDVKLNRLFVDPVKRRLSILGPQA